jgi:hypothetical protein
MEEGGGRPGNGNNGRWSPDGDRRASLRRNPEGGRVHPTTSQAGRWVIRELDASDDHRSLTEVEGAV